MSLPSALPPNLPAITLTNPLLPGPVTDITNPLEMGQYQNIWDNSIPNRSGVLVIVSITFVILASAAFYFRQIWRLTHNQRGWDDLMCLFAYLTLVVETTLCCLAAYYGFGRHRVYIERTLIKATFCFYIYQIFYKVLGMFTKLTFLVMYLRIFGVQNPKFRRFVWVILWLVVIGSMIFTFVSIWQCTPVKRAWNKTVNGHCVDNMAFWYSHAAWNTIMDIVIYIMPMPVIHTLQMTKGQKWGLSSVFLLGAFAIAASVVRMGVLGGSASAKDQTWGSSIALYWTQIEACTSIICCCLPALRAPFVQCWSKIRGKITSPNGSSNDRSRARSLALEALEGTAQKSRPRSTALRIDSPYEQNGNAERGIGIGKFTRAESKGNLDDEIQPSENQENTDSSASHEVRAPRNWYDNIMTRMDRDTRTPSNSSKPSLPDRISVHGRDSISEYHEHFMENGERADWDRTWPDITKTSDYRVSTHDIGSRPIRREDQEPTFEEMLAAGPPGAVDEEEKDASKKDGDDGRSVSFKDLLKQVPLKRKPVGGGSGDA